MAQYAKVKSTTNAVGMKSETIKELTTTMIEIKQNARKSNKKDQNRRGTCKDHNKDCPGRKSCQKNRKHKLL